MRRLLQHTLSSAQPVIGLVRKDATPDQLHDIYARVEAVIREAGPEAEEARVA